MSSPEASVRGRPQKRRPRVSRPTSHGHHQAAAVVGQIDRWRADPGRSCPKQLASALVQYKCRPLTPPAHQDRSKPQVESWPLPTARTAEDEFGPHAGARSLTHARARWNMVTLQPSGFVCSQSRASSSDLVTAPREVAGAGGPSRCRLQPVKRGACTWMDEVRPRWALVLPLLVQNFPSWRLGAMSVCSALNPPL